MYYLRKTEPELEGTRKVIDRLLRNALETCFLTACVRTFSPLARAEALTINLESQTAIVRIRAGASDGETC